MNIAALLSPKDIGLIDWAISMKDLVVMLLPPPQLMG